jgi:glycine cleavage system regulatory protein
MKVIEMNAEDKKEIIKEVAKVLEKDMRENITIRSLISQEIKAYFDEEKRIKAQIRLQKLNKMNENENERKEN